MERMIRKNIETLRKLDCALNKSKSSIEENDQRYKICEHLVKKAKAMLIASKFDIHVVGIDLDPDYHMLEISAVVRGAVQITLRYVPCFLESSYVEFSWKRNIYMEARKFENVKELLKDLR